MDVLRNVEPTTDREGVEDAVLRFVEGIDKRDEALLTSAFTEDVVLDMGGLDDSLGTFTPYEGRDTHLIRDRDHVWRISHHRVDGSWASGSVKATQL